MEETQAFRHLTRDADTGVGIELGFNKIALVILGKARDFECTYVL